MSNRKISGLELKLAYHQYFVRWLGYEGTDEEYLWVAADELIAKFHLRYPNKPGPLDKL